MSRSSETDISQVPLCIHVLRATLDAPLDFESKCHIALTLPSAVIRRTHTIRSNYELEWNKRYEFTSHPSHEIKFQLIVEGALSNRVYGEEQIKIDELLHRCQTTQYCILGLMKSSRKARGSVTVRLERRSSDTLSHELVDEEISQMEHGCHSPVTETNTGNDDQMVALRLLLGRMKPFIRVLGTASTIHPVFENTWESVSSLCKVYQKMKIVDADIKELARTMRNALKFVQNSMTVEILLSQSQRTVEKLLLIILESSQCIREYLDAKKIGRMWRTDSTINILREYKRQVESLSIELHGNAISNITDKIKNTRGKVESIHIIIPPPATDIFTGREDYLCQMEKIFDLTKTSVALKKQRKFILYGIGGMGKTQIALKFLERNSDRFTKQYIIDASSEESINHSFASIGDDLGIQDASISRVLTRLSQLKEDWLLIYDNADDPSVRLASFFPKVAFGNIIVTTRNAELSRLAPKGNIEVLMLEEEAAVSLLLQSSGLEENACNRNLAQRLVVKFGCLALAIIQAGSYIARERIDLRKYLEMYEKTPSALLRGDLGQEVDYKSPVFTTWELSYAGLSGSAQTLLNIFSFLYRDGITEDIIRLAVTTQFAIDATQGRQIVQPPDDYDFHSIPKLTPSQSLLDLIRLLCPDGKWNTYLFRELMRDLCSYSLVQRPFADVYSIHPLVYEWARDRLEDPNQEIFQHDVWLLLYYIGSTNHGSECVSVRRMLLPHINSCGRPNDVAIMETFAFIYSICGKWKSAESLQVYVVEQLVHEFGEGHPHTLWNKVKLGTFYWYDGRRAETEKLQVEVLEKTKETMGLGHPDTLVALYNLVLIYQNQGRVAEAEKLKYEMLEFSARSLEPSPHSPSTPQTPAERLEIEVLEALKRVLGPRHPQTLTSMARLAMAYLDQGRDDESAQLGAEVLEAMKQKTGPRHLNTIIWMANLGSIYCVQGRFIEAEELQAEALENCKQMLGPQHPNTLRIMNHLAITRQYLSEESRSNEEVVAPVLVSPAGEPSPTDSSYDLEQNRPDTPTSRSR